MKPRNPPLATTLTAAAASTAALFALQSHTEASIIYSGTNQSFTIAFTGKYGGTLTYLQMGAAALKAGVTHSFRSGHLIGQVALSENNLIFNGTNRVKKLALGSLISAGKVGATFGDMRQFVDGQVVGGTWASNEIAIAGFELEDGDFAWMRMKWDSTNGTGEPNSMTFVDWAYNDQPGQPIEAGQTVATPEPGTTALLALAGAGAAFLRRRRQD